VLQWSGITGASWIFQQVNPVGYGDKNINLLQISSIFTAPRDNLTTDQIDLYGGLGGESTTERLDLSWSRRWTYYRTVESLLVNDQSHKIQLEALSRLILRLVNQEKGRFGPHGTSLWSSRSWIPGTKRTHKPRNTTVHKVKHNPLSQLDVEACVSERTYYRMVHFTVWGWIYYRTIRSSRLEDKLIDGLV
jgi:hypothetical protein